MIRAVLFDYGAGNLHSLAKALEAGGATVRIEPDPMLILEGDVVVLPGVGAFGAAAARLAPARELVRSALEDGFPCLGVCLGMQLLFDESDEGPGVSGLGVLRGAVRRLRGARIPHMGWNEVVAAGKGGPDPLLAGTAPLVAYFANSFVAEPAMEDDVIAWTTYGDERFPSAVRRGRTLGVQFHPEKSGAPGLRLLRDFLAEVGA
jgi:glutamine amidotransferase